MTESQHTRGRPQLTAWVSVLLVLSGATALTYELVWFRRFSHAFGSSSLAMAAVLAAFLFGLGLGARTFGGIADRLRRPLLAYAACEAGIALCALLVPSAVGAMAYLLDAALRALPDIPALAVALQLLGATLVLAPPCVLMGATLPLCVRQFAPEGEGLGRTTAWLYAANTLGAAAGVWIAGFHLLPGLGLGWTRLLAIGANLFVAIAAVPLSLAIPPLSHAAPAPAPSRVRDLPIVRPSYLAIAAGAVGFATLALEIVWARQLAVILGGSTYAFTAMLCVVLIGISIGSLIVRAALARGRDPMRLLTGSVLLLALSLLLGQLAVPTLGEIVGALFERRAVPTFNALTCSVVSAVLELVPCACAGVSFPLLVHLAGGAPQSAGRVVGRVYLWNTLGTGAGAILSYAVLIPTLGVRTTLLVALAMYLGAYALIITAAAPRVRVARWVLALVVLALSLGLAPRHDPLVTERGLYVYGRSAFEVLEGAQSLFHAEGANANVLVTEQQGVRSLRVNGKVDASSHALDQLTQLGTAYLPRFLHPEGTEVCVIGHGSGATAGGSLLYPGVRVVCAEIEPAVFEAARLFSSVNHRPEDSPDFEVRFQDGRAFLQRTEKRFDLLLTEPSNPWIAGIASLFTREFLETARSRLAPEGVLGQWIQTYALSPSDYRLLLRTLLDSFPHLALLRLTGGDTMVLASDQEILRDPESFDRAQRQVDSVPGVRSDLANYFETTDVRSLLARHLLLGTEELRVIAQADGEQTLNTDHNLRLEFDAPLRLFEARSEAGFAVDRMLLEGVDIAFQRRLARAMGDDARSAPGFLSLARELRASGNAERAAELLELALELAPDHPGVIADLLIAQPPELDALEAALAPVLERSNADVMRVALAYEKSGDSARARAVLELLIAKRPNSVTARARRAELLIGLGELDEARREIDALVELDPLNGAVREAVRRLRAK